MIHTKSSGILNETESIAIVGESEDMWRVEQKHSSFAGWVMGLTVAKKNGETLKAVLGRPGEAGKPIEIAAPTPLPVGFQYVEDLEEEVTIEIGTFPAMKAVNPFSTSWTGTEGVLEGILIAVSTGVGPYQLTALPSREVLDCDGVAVEVMKCTYSNDSIRFRTTEQVVAALAPSDGGFGTYKEVTPGVLTHEIAEIRQDARAELVWD